MARLLPHPLPPEVIDDPRRAGERRVFEALKQGLNDEWLVLANITWLRKRYQGGFYEGEADAIIAHPEKGIIVLEVKGGGIRVDGTSGRWFSRDRHGDDHDIKNPFEQARRSLGALRSLLADEVSVAFRNATFAPAVAFPDLATPPRDLGPDSPGELGIFHDQLDDIRTAIERVLRYSSDNDVPSGPGAANVAAMREMLMPDLHLEVPLSVRIRDDEEQLLQLTEGQKRALALISRLRRVAVNGGAGTGKTVLAVEKARQLAAHGAEVLFLCINNGLARNVREQCAGIENITAKTFHALCREWALESGVLSNIPSSPSPAFWDVELPDLFLQSLDIIPRRFDAVVVDEGQDFHDDWWMHVEEVTREPGESTLYVFHDDNQRIMRESSGIPADLVSIPLDENVRNTRAIHSAAEKLYSGEAFVCNGPQGTPIELLEVPEGKQAERVVRSLLHRLVREQGVAPGDIAILSARTRERSIVGIDGSIGVFECASLADATPGVIVRDSIHRFKGLERSAIILVDMEQALERPELLYVGITRARTYAAIVESPGNLTAIREVIAG